MNDCEHMRTFPRHSKYTLIIEHLIDDLRAIGLHQSDIDLIIEDARENGQSLIAVLRAARKERTK